jgi:hypothetical protein
MNALACLVGRDGEVRMRLKDAVGAVLSIATVLIVGMGAIAATACVLCTSNRTVTGQC